MANLKLKKGDKVIVIAGSEKGKTGKIEQVNPNDNTVVIEGVNVKKRHQKGNQGTVPGGVFEKAMPINASNVAIQHPSKKDQATRIGYKVDAKGNKTRVYKSNNKEIK